MTQRYTSPEALERMSRGACPECGFGIDRHDGWGGPQGCTLTDGGVTLRLDQYRRDFSDEQWDQCAKNKRNS